MVVDIYLTPVAPFKRGTIKNKGVSTIKKTLKKSSI